MRGWLCPRMRVKSLTLSSPPASKAKIRSRVGSAAALSTLTMERDARPVIATPFGRSHPYIHMFICFKRGYREWSRPRVPFWQQSRLINHLAKPALKSGTQLRDFKGGLTTDVYHP